MTLNKYEDLADKVDRTLIGLLPVEGQDPYWFKHPDFDGVFGKVGDTKDGRTMVVWITYDASSGQAVVLDVRPITQQEHDYIAALRTYNCSNVTN